MVLGVVSSFKVLIISKRALLRAEAHWSWSTQVWVAMEYVGGILGPGQSMGKVSVVREHSVHLLWLEGWCIR